MVQPGEESTVYLRTVGAAVRTPAQCTSVHIRTNSEDRVGWAPPWGGAGRTRHAYATLETKGW